MDSLVQNIRRAVLVIVVFALSAGSSFAEEPTRTLHPASQMLSVSDGFLDGLTRPVPLHGDRVRVKFGGEFRYRLELRDDFNFNDAANEDDAVHLFRNRLNADLAFDPYFRVFIEGQDAESFADSSLNRTTAFVDRMDLRQLYGELKSPWKKVPLTLKAGRQELSYGDQRFVGPFGWSNVGRVFDAAKVIYDPVPWLQADAWFSQVTRVRRNRADSGAHEDNLYGVYTSLRPLLDHVFDTFLFIRHNRNNEIVGEKAGAFGQLKEYTAGNRFKGKKWNFDYGIEWAWQFGSRSHDDIKAWAWHNEVGYTFVVLPWEPRLHFEYNHGSGDDDPRDGDFKNFDNLFPTNHFFYGYMDFASLRNMNDVTIGTDLKPHRKIKLSCDYHWFFLDTNRSAWFGAGQNVIRPARSGASTTVGQELDLLARWEVTKHIGFLIGYSHFHAGPFVKDTGVHDAAEFFYVQTLISV